MNNNINFITLHKMIFIYNAVKLGWTVRCIDGNKFEFKKKDLQINSGDPFYIRCLLNTYKTHLVLLCFKNAPPLLKGPFYIN